MKFDKKDENYIYGVIGRNVKKYRKEKELTQQQLADNINYSLSFVSVLESKKTSVFFFRCFMENIFDIRN